MKERTLNLKKQWKSSAAVKSKEEITFNRPAVCITHLNSFFCNIFLKLTHCFFLVWEISCLCWPASFLISSKNSSLHFSFTCLHFLSISPCALATALFTACLFSSSISVRSCHKKVSKVSQWATTRTKASSLNLYYGCGWRSHS